MSAAVAQTASAGQRVATRARAPRTVGVAPEALHGVDGALCAPFDDATWRAALQQHLTVEDPRLRDGRAHAEPYSSDACAQKVLEAWTELLDRRGW